MDCAGRGILSVRQRRPLRLAIIALYRGEVERRGPAMPITEKTPHRLVLKSGSTTLTLDKTAGKVVLQRKVLLWGLKPVEASLSEVGDITVDTAVDRASGVEVCHTMLIMQAGAGWAFPAADKAEAETNAAAMRDFLGMAASRRAD
jgi:hypothetical protein